MYISPPYTKASPIAATKLDLNIILGISLPLYPLSFNEVVTIDAKRSAPKASIVWYPSISELESTDEALVLIISPIGETIPLTISTISKISSAGVKNLPIVSTIADFFNTKNKFIAK